MAVLPKIIHVDDVYRVTLERKERVIAIVYLN
jgi:hypothetical protein